LVKTATMILHAYPVIVWMASAAIVDAPASAAPVIFQVRKVYVVTTGLVKIPKLIVVILQTDRFARSVVVRVSASTPQLVRICTQIVVKKPPTHPAINANTMEAVMVPVVAANGAMELFVSLQRVQQDSQKLHRFVMESVNVLKPTTTSVLRTSVTTRVRIRWELQEPHVAHSVRTIHIV